MPSSWVVAEASSEQGLRGWAEGPVLDGTCGPDRVPRDRFAGYSHGRPDGSAWADYSAGANSWKNVGNVRTRPAPTRIAVHENTLVAFTALPRSTLCRTTQDRRNTATEMIVFPASGPTAFDHSRADLMLSFASASVVSIPRTRLPIPAARKTAATGPNGLSAGGGQGSGRRVRVSHVSPSSVHRGGVGDEGPQRASDSCDQKGSGEEDE